MNRIKSDSLAKMVLTSSYSTTLSRHVDNFYCGDVNFWRDIFTPSQLEALMGRKEGDTVELESDTVLKTYDANSKRTVKQDLWQPPDQFRTLLAPKIGRWYPQGYLRGIPGVFPQTLTPMRIVGQKDDTFVVDCNHPLAGMSMTVSASLEKIKNSRKERGGRCCDWIDEAHSGGPGMQIFLEDRAVDYQESHGYHRLLDGDDGRFYQKVRNVSHIDTLAQKHLAKSLQGVVTEDMKLLDLMASVQSHLPQKYSAYGLGMNGEEMAANANLHEWCVHDLNRNPVLPFADSSFDLIMCNLSIEYLLHPHRVIGDCARVLQQNGLIFISFSNRWFPEKVTAIWQMLHEFERLGYVMNMLRESFKDLQTVSYRNWPRPYDDPHILTQQLSDPVYIVTARKR